MSGWDGLGKAANVVQLLQAGYSIVKRAVVTYTTHANTGGQNAIPGDESEVKAAQQLKAAGEWLAQAAEVLDGVPDAESEDISRLLLEYQAAKSLRQLSDVRARCMDNYRVLRLDYVAATRAKHYDAWDLMSEQLGYLIEELKDLHLDATTTTTLPAKERKQIREGKNVKIRNSSPARISVADLELGVQ
ncbi:hypothetical protein EWM64_g8405 [Hericium alpestre]|uniref:Uncharacterized protein n=1 Tax=Hericium alpestre TaxID=135208 RepID=A0A4Y9ZQ40_9AGAM|nr:hypothetical protein EWM64_g8405 [Hericium alpestre]